MYVFTMHKTITKCTRLYKTIHNKLSYTKQHRTNYSSTPKRNVVTLNTHIYVQHKTISKQSVNSPHLQRLTIRENDIQQLCKLLCQALSENRVAKQNLQRKF